jgi:hypothetical protein
MTYPAQLHLDKRLLMQMRTDTSRSLGFRPFGSLSIVWMRSRAGQIEASPPVQSSGRIL